MKELNKLEVQDVNGGFSPKDIIDDFIDLLDKLINQSIKK